MDAAPGKNTDGAGLKDGQKTLKYCIQKIGRIRDGRWGRPRIG
jgi:hypothetical protein